MTPPTSAGYAAAQAALLARADEINAEAQLGALTAAHQDLHDHDRRVLSTGVVAILIGLAAVAGLGALGVIHDRSEATLAAFASAGGEQ